ncbi:MAG: PilZ domain-containing protein [Planctomycetota bacterium]|nr:MAG: PilZ domain-containing protein [Planctomycetota bacterium]
MPPIDLQPTLWLLIFVLVCLAFAMPVTGGRARRRREGWARFDRVVRRRNVLPVDREALARWARIACPDAPDQVVTRRKTFDRYARGEVARLRGLPADEFAFRLAALGALRRSLGFEGRDGPAQSTHDLRPGELLDLRSDDGEQWLLRVTRCDEEGVHVAPITARRTSSPLPARPGWASFSREGEGAYRFRTRLVRPGVLDHGEFLVLEERRLAARVALSSTPFWVAVERLPDGEAPEDPEGVEVETVDVSTGGVALLADRRVRRGSELSLDLPLGTGTDAELVSGLRARVLACGYREGGGRRPHFIHCAFVRPSSEQVAALADFVEAHSVSRQETA